MTAPVTITFTIQPRSRGFSSELQLRRPAHAMSDNYYSEINLHLTWHTKLSRPLLTPEVEAMTFGCLREKAASLGDVFIHEIGGTATHVNVAL